MIVSHKSASFSLSLTPLYVDHSHFELVNSFKYLGVIILSNLSWSAHIRSVCSKSRQSIGVIFRHFYHSSSSWSLLKMYIALILPHLLYCSSVWDPPSGFSLASVLKKIALYMCIYNWSANYLDLLSNLQLPSLSTRRSQSKLFIIYKILNNLIYFPPKMFICIPPPIRSSHSYHPLNVLTPYCKTSAT